MNFTVSPFAIPGRIALFRPRTEDAWRINASSLSESDFRQHEVVAILSNDRGHFLLLLKEEELATIRDLCKSENCEFLGIFNSAEIRDEIARQISTVSEMRPQSLLSCPSRTGFLT